MADKDDKKKDEEETLVMVGDGVTADDQPAGGKKPPLASETDEDPESDDEGADDEEEGDTRAGHADQEEAGEDARQTTSRQKRQERKLRQQRARERTEKELNFLRGRNEQLERRFSQVEARQRHGEVGSIDAQLETINQQIAEAKQIEAAAIESNEGEDAVEAREIKTALERRRDRLIGRKESLAKAPTAGEVEIPPEAELAIDWIRENQGWYDPKGRNQDSRITQAIETSLMEEGMNPRTPKYWEELNKRIKRVIPHVFKKKDQGEDEGDELEDEDEPEEGKLPRSKTNGNGSGKKPAGGPRVTIGGQPRTLRANEVYVSPERKAAMIEAGVWDDPVLRNRQLRKYREWDLEHGNT